MVTARVSRRCRSLACSGAAELMLRPDVQRVESDKGRESEVVRLIDAG